MGLRRLGIQISAFLPSVEVRGRSPAAPPAETAHLWPVVQASDLGNPCDVHGNAPGLRHARRSVGLRWRSSGSTGAPLRATPEGCRSRTRCPPAIGRRDQHGHRPWSATPATGFHGGRLHRAPRRRLTLTASADVGAQVVLFGLDRLVEAPIEQALGEPTGGGQHVASAHDRLTGLDPAGQGRVTGQGRHAGSYPADQGHRLGQPTSGPRGPGRDAQGD